MQYYYREIEPTLLNAAQQFCAVIITGPRQSGKTTLLNHCFKDTHQYVTLDDLQLKTLAINDPKLFLETFSPPVIIDEIQYAPNLLNYIKIHIDQNRDQKGQFLLTGSQQFSLMKGVTESLAGRAAILNLMTYCSKEKLLINETLFENTKSLFSDWLRGSFPEIVINKNVDDKLWYTSYLQTYLERDIRNLREIGNLHQFQIFLQLLAIRNAQVLNLSNIAQDLGLSINTIKSWLSILEAGGQIYLVQPYYKNKGKRLIKAPKIYFTDTGIYTHLIGLSNIDEAMLGSRNGVLIENAVFNEIIRFFTNKGLQPNIYFWRTSKGQEIDFIVEYENKIIPIEVKLTKTLQLSFTKNLDDFCFLFQDEIKTGYLISLAEEELVLSQFIKSIPFKKTYTIFQNNE